MPAILVSLAIRAVVNLIRWLKFTGSYLCLSRTMPSLERMPSSSFTISMESFLRRKLSLRGRKYITRESESWKDYRLEVFEEIIKEGRKFGVFMTIASQRPSDISSTIISQLHNYFIHRLMNERDIQQVSNTISYLDKVSVESLPILSTGVCVLAGQLAEMPIIVQIDRIEEKNKPQNETINLIKAWDE